MNAPLLRVVRTVVAADCDPARQTLFESLRSSRLSVRLAVGLHGLLGRSWGAALFVSSYGLVSFFTIGRPHSKTARVLAVAEHANARRQVARVTTWIGRSECDMLHKGATAVSAPPSFAEVRAFFTPRKLLRALRILRSIDRRYGFLVACRAADTIAWYGRSKAILQAHRPGVALVSGDSNPEEVGFVGAARALGISQVFVSHAYPTPFSPPLDFTLSILEGEAAVQARSRKGPIRGDVLLAGVEGDSGALDVRRFERSNPVIGIFPPKALSWATLVRIIHDCRHHYRASRVVIRWHPSMLEPSRLPDLLDDPSGVIESPRSASLQEVAEACDWVVAAENSNVHLPVLKLGIPTVAVKSLGLYPESRSDLYGFVADGIVFPPVKSIRDVEAAALGAFFSDGWKARFQHYDASYLRPHSDIGPEVREAVRRLFDARGQTIG